MGREYPEQSYYGGETSEVTERAPQQARSIEYQLELAKEIRRTILKLQGYTFDWNSRTWKVPKNDKGERKRYPMLNEKGVQLIDTVIGAELNKNTILSNLSDQEITRIILGVYGELNKEFTFHRKKYGVQVEVGTILNTVCDPIYFALKRARNAGERQSITESSQRIERTVEQGNTGNKIRNLLGI